MDNITVNVDDANNSGIESFYLDVINQSIAINDDVFNTSDPIEAINSTATV